jgi:hypothetical protein
MKTANAKSLAVLKNMFLRGLICTVTQKTQLARAVFGTVNILEKLFKGGVINFISYRSTPFKINTFILSKKSPK